jgi:hypothetical protein
MVYSSRFSLHPCRNRTITGSKFPKNSQNVRGKPKSAEGVSTALDPGTSPGIWHFMGKLNDI